MIRRYLGDMINLSTRELELILYLNKKEEESRKIEFDLEIHNSNFNKAINNLNKKGLVIISKKKNKGYKKNYYKLSPKGNKAYNCLITLKELTK